MKMEKEIITKYRPVKTNQKLPKEIGDVIRGLSLLEKKAYANVLVNHGWTYQSIANELKISREAVRLYCLAGSNSDFQKKVSHLPIPNTPTKEITTTRVKRKKLDPQVVTQLKELHAKASLVRGKSKKYRAEAEQFTKLAWQQKENGVSIYAIAKAINITHGALLFRFVRYGYLKTTGKSKVFKSLTHRVKESN